MAESMEEKQQRISQELAHAQPQDYAARQRAEYQRIINRIDREPERRLAWCSFPFMPLKPITTSDGASHNPPELARLVVCEFMSGC